MTNNRIIKSFILIVMLGLLTSFSNAQDQADFDEQEMMPPPEYFENSDMNGMPLPPKFDKNASGTFRMRRPPRRHYIGSGTMEMMPPAFEGDASGTFRMRRPPRRHYIGSGTMEMMPPAFEGYASGTFRMRRPPRRHYIGSGTMEMMPPAFEGDASGTYRMRRPPMPPREGRGRPAREPNYKAE